MDLLDAGRSVAGRTKLDVAFSGQDTTRPSREAYYKGAPLASEASDGGDVLSSAAGGDPDERVARGDQSIRLPQEDIHVGVVVGDGRDARRIGPQGDGSNGQAVVREAADHLTDQVHRVTHRSPIAAGEEGAAGLKAVANGSAGGFEGGAQRFDGRSLSLRALFQGASEDLRFVQRGHFPSGGLCRSLRPAMAKPLEIRRKVGAVLARIAITMGEPAGIGPEICLKALRAPAFGEHDVRLIGSVHVLGRCAQALGLRMPEDGQLIDVPIAGADGIAPGTVTAAGGEASAAYIERACEIARAGEVDAIVTAPINKESLRAAGVPHIGHTELLAAAFGVAHPLTLFVIEGLRVFFLSRHLSLRQAIDYATRERVLDMLRRVHEAMGQLGFDRPSIAVAAMNPHASDGGQFGTEEAEHLEPAVRDAQSEGIDARGPIGADSVFHQGLQGQHDCVLSLYHDQGHIATKTRDFHGTISATLGLPVLRTSVDHGTAFDIAWQGKASEYSLIKAIDVALDLLRRRR